MIKTLSKYNLGPLIILTLTLAVCTNVLTENPGFFIKALGLSVLTIPLNYMLLNLMNFRLWLLAGILLFSDGIAISEAYSQAYHQWFAAAAFSWGLSALVLLMPSSIKHDASLWTAALILCAPVSFLWSHLFNRSILFLAASMFAASQFMVKAPALQLKHQPNPMTDGRISSYTFPFLFAASVSASLITSLSFFFNNSETVTSLLPSEYSWAYTFCSGVSAFICSRIINSRGPFFQSVIIIFSCEVSVLLSGFVFISPAASALALFLLMYAAGSIPVTIPCLCQLFFGPVNRLENLTFMWISASAGMLSAFPTIIYMKNHGTDLYSLSVILIFYLTLSMIGFFSAWKHRFFVLQSPVS